MPWMCDYYIVAIFYPFSQFCEMNISLPSLQKEPNTAPTYISEGGRIWQVCVKKTHLRRKVPLGISRSGAGEQFLLPHCVAKAGAFLLVVFTDTGVKV